MVKLFEHFVNDWYEQYNHVKYAIRLINLYPDELLSLNLGNIIQFEQVDEYQSEWIWLYNQFDNDIEKTYFKTSLIPFNSDDYKLFVDLSNKNFPVIEPIYNSQEHQWYHLTRFEKIIDLIIYLDSNNSKPLLTDKEFSQSIDEIINTYLIENPELHIKLIELINKYRN